MNNPTSPLSGRPLSECDNREVDAWCCYRRGEYEKEELCELLAKAYKGPFLVTGDYTHDGNAALSLMQSDVWPESVWILDKTSEGFYVRDISDDLQWLTIAYHAASPAAAIARAWLVAKEAKEAEG